MLQIVPLGAFIYVNPQVDSKDADEYLRLLEAYAREHDLEVLDVFTAVDFEGRLDLKAGSPLTSLLTRLHQKEASIILAERLESFSSELAQQEILRAHLELQGFTLLVRNEHEAAKDKSMRQIFREYSKKDQELRPLLDQLKLQAARALVRFSGRKCGGNPKYGTLPGEAVHLGRILSLKQSGKSDSHIAKLLNEENTPPRRGVKWHPTTIANILGARRDVARRQALKTQAIKKANGQIKH